MKKILIVLTLCFAGLFLGALPAHAATERILLVYDSLSIASEGEQQVDSLQRLLTSLGAEVHSIQDNSYISGMLTDEAYTGVISMVNWPEKGLHSATFLHDRQAFHGKKMYIGADTSLLAESPFTGSFKTLSHRQFALVQEQGMYTQQLDYRDQTTVLLTTNSQQFGLLRTQEAVPQEYAFGVLENHDGFLPFYSDEGAVFLQSSELLHGWLGLTASYHPMLTINQFTPLHDMTVAETFIQQMSDLSVYYALSTTSTNRNVDLTAYQLFITQLKEAQRTGILFLEVPAVNNVNLNDSQALATLMEDQISLLVSNDTYPVGLSAPGYWNQDSDYRGDALSLTQTLILEASPTIQEQRYRKEDDRGEVYTTAFYALSAEQLDNVTWSSATDKTAYRFAMPVSYSLEFPKTQREADDVIERIKSSPFNFANSYDSQYTFQLETVTQRITYAHGRLMINGQSINHFVNSDNTVAAVEPFSGLFSQFFSRVNTVLILFILFILLTLAALFLWGRKNYRAKYYNGGKKK